MNSKLSFWRTMAQFLEDQGIEPEVKKNPNPPYSQMRFRIYARTALVSLGYASGHGETLDQAAANFFGCFAHLIKRA